MSAGQREMDVGMKTSEQAKCGATIKESKARITNESAVKFQDESNALSQSMTSRISPEVFDMLNNVFINDPEAKSYSIGEIMDSLIDHAKHPGKSTKPKFVLMSEEADCMFMNEACENAEEHEKPTFIPYVKKQTVTRSLQRDLCWTPEQIVYYIHDVLCWKGSSGNRESNLPLPMKSIMVYENKETGEHEIFCGQHRFVMLVAYRLVLFPALGMNEEGIYDPRYLFNAYEPGVVNDAIASLAYPPTYSTTHYHYWSLVETKVIDPQKNDTLNFCVKQFFKLVETLTGQPMKHSFQTGKSQSLCYNYLDKATCGHLETYSDAIHEVKNPTTGKSVMSTKTSTNFKDWVNDFSRIRISFSMYSSEKFTKNTCKVLSNFDNVRVARESLGTYFLQTPGDFNKTLRLFAEPLMTFLGHCMYEDECSAMHMYNYSERNWLLAARLAMCVVMGYGNVSKVSFSYIEMSAEVDAFKMLLMHEKFDWPDPEITGNRIATCLFMLTEELKAMKTRREDERLEETFLDTFWFDEQKFFYMMILMYHYVAMLPVDEQNIPLINKHTSRVFKEITRTVITSASVVFTYAYISEKERDAEKSTHSAEKNPTFFHMELKRNDVKILDDMCSFLNDVKIRNKLMHENIMDPALGLFKDTRNKFKDVYGVDNKLNPDTNVEWRLIDLLAETLRDTTLRKSNVLQRSTIGVVANIMSIGMYESVQKFIAHTLKAGYLKLPEYYDEAKPYALTIEPKMQVVTKECIADFEGAHFTVGVCAELLENMPKPPETKAERAAKQAALRTERIKKRANKSEDAANTASSSKQLKRRRESNGKGIAKILKSSNKKAKGGKKKADNNINAAKSAVEDVDMADATKSNGKAKATESDNDASDEDMQEDEDKSEDVSDGDKSDEDEADEDEPTKKKPRTTTEDITAAVGDFTVEDVLNQVGQQVGDIITP